MGLTSWPLLGLLLLTACAPPRGTRIAIGAKNFTEQVLVGEMLAQQIEAIAAAEGRPQRVERRFYLAGSYLCQQALVSGRIDGYVEYTGTALSALLKQPLPESHDPALVLKTVGNLYQQRFHVRVEPALGFEDTFAMVVRGADAQRLNLQFGAPRVMDLGLLYRALAAGQVDIVAGNSTDGPIRAMGLTVLADDRHYFPPYEAVPLFREDSLRLHPEIQLAVDRLAGKISAAEMQAMNDAVDGRHEDAAQVVRAFRSRRGL